MNLGEQIAFEAWRAYETWLRRWADDLENVDTVDRTRVYSYMCDGIDIDLAKAMVKGEGAAKSGET
jgi:hypothetical protein